jgi:signal transduction histidine kinase
MTTFLGLSRATLQWVTVWGPACYLSVLAVTILYLHPHPLPPFWPALAIVLTLSAVGTFAFSQFVFAHVQRQEQEILRGTRELAEAKEAMAVVKERQRIARDLHDSLAQNLGYLHLRLAEAERGSGSVPRAQLEGELAELKKVARSAYEEARQAILGLRSVVAGSIGLLPTLSEYLDDWSRHAGVAVDLKVGAEASIALPPVVEVQLLGIVQEAMTNVRKHAGARRAVVSIAEEPGAIRVSIRDDGVGFDPAPVDGKGRTAFGLDTMRERAEAVGGRLRLTSSPGQGTAVDIELPVREAARGRG